MPVKLPDPQAARRFGVSLDPESLRDAPLPMTGELLKTAFANAPEPLLLIDPLNDVILRANKTACAIYALTSDELLKRAFSGLYKECRGELLVVSEEAFERGHAWSRDLVLRRPDGSAMDLEHGFVACKQRDRRYLLVSILDLTSLRYRSIDSEADSYHRQGLDEWRRAERFFREIERENQMILSAAGEGIYGVNADGITTFVNPAAEAMLGWKAEELVGSEMHSMIHHSHADGTCYPNASCPIFNAFREGKINTVDDEVFWRKDGKPLRVEYTSTPIVDDGAMVGAVIVFRDISERKQSEEQLRQALEENAALRERLEKENAYLQEEILTQSNHHEILGNSAAVKKILQQIDLVAPTDASVLITGESGTGKELVARAIHQASDRRDRPLIRVNCAAIPRELFESEFFGHVKGAFTGALRDRVGRFELADGGTIFLDEVGEIPLDLQSKLLRVLQDRRFERLGDEKTREVDIRLIAATNRNLKKEAAAGRFREDLYFRINVFPIECTPLRERSDDIPILAQHFLKTVASRLNLKKLTLTNANIETLRAYAWPGNARELQNVIERAMILARHGRLQFHLPGDTASAGKSEEAATDEGRILTSKQMSAFEKANIERALLAVGGKVSGTDGAAALLGMKATTLYSKIKNMGIGEKRTA
ncbi:sigma 54-interacting transcriptional regulator [Denitrobaculum tricleocarpae]|nr:sigma 54-interacting transcriptional regulator [Denitrobaculum tricleocarpae]